MNCANHPETPVASYCQFCGKPLCDQCVHKVNNIVSCEPCLAARVQSATAGAYTTTTGSLPPGVQLPPIGGTEPWIAFILGWIPGVGAMYNGQLAKALAHVVIFALLVYSARFNGVLGLLIAAWILYQVFDAYQTAVARRDGLPLPNPLGLNDVAHWFGARPYPTTNPWFDNGGNPNTANESPNPSNPGATTPAGQSEGAMGENGPGFRPASGFASPYVAPPVPPVPPNPIDPPGLYWGNRGIPASAVVFIVLGVAFLLGNLGILSDHWMRRGWPIFLIALGIWIVIQRSQRPPSGDVR